MDHKQLCVPQPLSPDISTFLAGKATIPEGLGNTTPASTLSSTTLAGRKLLRTVGEVPPIPHVVCPAHSMSVVKHQCPPGVDCW